MSVSSELVEKLAQHYFLTPTLVQEAAQLFDAYTDGDTNTVGETEAAEATETRISVTRLQQLLMALGAPLSQQDVVEILQLFSSSASSALPTSITTDAAATSGSGSGGHRQPYAASSTALRKGDKSSSNSSHRHHTEGDTRSQTNKPAPSSRRITSAPPTSSSTTADAHLQDGGDPPSLEESGVSASPTAGREAAVSRKAEGARKDGAQPSTTAVNMHGMTFPAFLYFLLVYPSLVQHVAQHIASSAAAANAVTSAVASVDVAELFAQLDSDGDGVCSAQDLRRAAELCATDHDGLLLDDPDLCRLAEMHPVELEEAIREYDLDGDGVVTLSDLQRALQ
ncbi:hypothetical protein ABB37_02174 [Leptomonas pyrrhocoris]|uniref:EF-hand domain-containing protein n=1 Tax=Leptomonas pyrrhocoris TaxID=157538 RepID=A0A0N0DYE2_LEPPY|nr:hypothetical protein ABB37_02174 [Leptomonas pyrrhocoris]XP_015662488.1 hypothetical protein ABB37_02174 [Leptomonas pyrrhocoris]XP_015662489.1 hypothetical protein ABB37_02174 [Leptomonas pyrrhocoris]KPA84048.1 hypothetical protein ABB37_02174 [Leptomonas pyrrhocoris]KPA84049.1 hypothetical protein ABB37_02174 [Leptomonas pyrrhocoris]KPA84050.1 hypothetical protein ABB37_02174 [Leptomonas pyrrhocoris]|eukprot:XP_015662487.1 hypothetical protein ABB37_02174 [Leptomonas pyrrhocoris]